MNQAKDTVVTLINGFDVSKILSEDLGQIFWRLAICIVVGILVGLEREHSKKAGTIFAGIRTFPLISMLGFLSALLSTFISPWVFIVSLLGFILLVIASYIMLALDGKRGITTDMAGVLVFLLGALVYWNFIILSVSIAVVITAILSLQPQLAKIAKSIVEEDIYATLKFASITLIILPILPDRTFDPFNVLNPRYIWLMVILIAAISFLGYILIKLAKPDKAIRLTGLLGGIVSSTAITLTFSQRSKENKSLSRLFASAIILASTVMFPRVLVETFVLNQSLFSVMIFPISILTLTGLITSLIVWHSAKTQISESVDLNNPFRLSTAIKFGLIFAAILFVSKVSQFYFGNNGVYYACILGGMTDVSAVTLSMANLANSSISTSIASKGIIMGILANTVVKCGIVAFLADPSLKKFVYYSFGLVFFTGIVIILFFM